MNARMYGAGGLVALLGLGLMLGLGCGGSGGLTIELTANDEMQYSMTGLVAEAGQTVTIRLRNVGTKPKEQMAHNVVLLAAGTDAEAFVVAAMDEKATGYIPPEMRDAVIAHTGLAGPGETVSVTFTAPAAGTYTYVCSFPAHYQNGMVGTLTVRAP